MGVPSLSLSKLKCEHETVCGFCLVAWRNAPVWKMWIFHKITAKAQPTVHFTIFHWKSCLKKQIRKTAIESVDQMLKIENYTSAASLHRVCIVREIMWPFILGLTKSVNEMNKRELEPSCRDDELARAMTIDRYYDPRVSFVFHFKK